MGTGNLVDFCLQRGQNYWFGRHLASLNSALLSSTPSPASLLTRQRRRDLLEIRRTETRYRASADGGRTSFPVINSWELQLDNLVDIRLEVTSSAPIIMRTDRRIVVGRTFVIRYWRKQFERSKVPVASFPAVPISLSPLLFFSFRRLGIELCQTRESELPGTTPLSD